MFLRHLKQRGLSGTRLFVSDVCLGLSSRWPRLFPEADWQRCVVHWYRNAFSCVPKSKVEEVAAMLKAIHVQKNYIAALKKAGHVAEKLSAMKLADTAMFVRDSVQQTLS